MFTPPFHYFEITGIDTIVLYWMAGFLHQKPGGFVMQAANV